jgi:leader peptidase (prepilin peptidase)/N-methyltransferase
MASVRLMILSFECYIVVHVMPTYEYIYTIVVATLFGMTIGSFLNVVIYRVPKRLSLVSPRSFCPVCKTPIRATDNVPVLSWLLLHGKCRHCHTPISPRYPVVEGTTGLTWGAITAWQLYAVYARHHLHRSSIYMHLGILGGLLVASSVLIVGIGILCDHLRS